jgi:hypothetical protein
MDCRGIWAALPCNPKTLNSIPDLQIKHPIGPVKIGQRFHAIILTGPIFAQQRNDTTPNTKDKQFTTI